MRNDIDKTKERLISELEEMRQRMAQLETLEAERKRVEEELRKREQEFRALVENAPDVIARFDREFRHVYINPAVEKESGMAREAFIGKTNPEMGTPEDLAAKWHRTIKSVFQTGREMVIETEYPTPTGIKHYSNRLAPEFAEDGHVETVLNISRDITERKRAEEKLKEYSENLEKMVEQRTKELGESEAELATIFDNTPIVMILVDQERRVRKVNYNAVKFARRAAEEMIGLHGGEALRCIHSSDDPRGCGFGLYCKGCPIRRTVLRTFKTRKNHYRVEAKLQFASRRGDVVVLVSTTLLNLEEGERVLVCIEDITERKEAEEREKQLQAELIHSRRLAAIGELAAGVAHEINNPLTGVLGYSQRLLRKSTDEEISRELARVHGAAQRVSKIVENLLTFARRRETRKEHVDVNEILQRTLELRAYELKTSNIEVEVECASRLPEVMADFHQMQEVFLNLILNAEQVMGEANKGGKLNIKTARVKGGIKVSFADDGPGIKAENLDSLFDPFFTTRGERGGTGLGLSVCHGIVAEHGGKIYAESEEGKGTTFSVELPAASKK